MQLITTTELRTKTAQLVKALQLGEEVSLIHRSRVVGQISPKRDQPRVFTHEDALELTRLAKQMNLPVLTDKQMEKNYRNHLVKKYGKHLSGR